MGSTDPLARPDEQPVHRVRVHGFWADITEVTNAQFAAFVAATGYKTVAERPVAMLTVMFMAVLFAFLWLLVHLAARRWERERRYTTASQRIRP